jgi:hypothetical protein
MAMALELETALAAFPGQPNPAQKANMRKRYLSSCEH